MQGGQKGYAIEINLFWTNDTITATSSSLPPVYPLYPAARAESANGLFPNADFPTSCALLANSFAISYEKNDPTIEM